MSFYNRNILPKILNSFMWKPSFQKLRKEVIKNAQGQVLEIGFWTWYSLQCYDWGKIDRLDVLEPSKELTKLASLKQHQEKMNYICAWAENIPIKDNTFDTVISCWTLCSVNDPSGALSEIFRVLKPWGEFCFVEHWKSPKKSWDFLQNILTPFSRRVCGGCHLNRKMESLISNSWLKIRELRKFSEKGKPLAYTFKWIAVK